MEPHRPRQPRSHSQTATGYGRAFWMCYAANIAQMIAVSLLFRYADFVHFLGGSDFQLGLITGIGMTGAVMMRIFQGSAIDRVGPRRVWLFSLAGLVLSLLGHCLLGGVTGPAVYVLRILMMVSLAGAFGASLTHVSLLAPPNRMAEFIGVLGSSGFVGMALGPVLGDYLLGGAELNRSLLNQMFQWASVLALVALVLAIGSGRSLRRPASKTRRPSLWLLITRYHPGPLLLVGAAMGLALGLPGVFVRPFAADLGIDHIKIYFLVYAGTAFSVRFATRRWTDQRGIRPVILASMSILALSMLSYCLVSSAWTLAIPAVLSGVAHAMLFPAVVTGAGRSFPARYRGLATNLILAMFDLGALIGQPLAGAILRAAGSQGWPRYPSMFVAVALIMILATVYYLVARPRTPRATERSRWPDRQEPVAPPLVAAVIDQTPALARVVAASDSTEKTAAPASCA